MKLKLYTITSLLVIFMLVACKTTKDSFYKPASDSLLSPQERVYLDSVFNYGLDREALYTLLGDIKPMSSLQGFSFPLANTDSTLRISGTVVDVVKNEKHLARLRFVQQALSKLDLPDLKVVLVPYKNPRRNSRMMQLCVFRMSTFNKMLKEQESFFSQYGIVEGADPAMVLAVIENAGKYERNRAYGYLFGYPGYAVDYFVETVYNAEKNNAKIKNNNFFQIPAYSTEKGAFVYAYPDGYTPTAEVDSVLYYKAEKVLKEYQAIRPTYLNADSTLQGYKLILDFINKK